MVVLIGLGRLGAIGSGSVLLRELEWWLEMPVQG